VDGRRIWSKLETKQFPDDDVILAALEAGSPAAKAKGA
jgi:hypothetical protein